MKKIILVFALLLSLSGFAQNYPGNNPDLLTGKTVKVLPLKESLQSYGFRGFFKDAELQKNYKKSGATTPYKVLVGKEFKVTAIERYKKPLKNDVRYRLVLDNAETGTLYYDYDEVSSVEYPFEVIGGLEFPADHFCSLVTPANAKPHEPDGKWFETTKPLEGISIFGYKGKESLVRFYIDFNTGEKDFQTPKGKGVTLTFDNGETISRPDDDVIPASDGGNVLTVKIMAITPAQVKLVQEHSLISIKVGKYEKAIKNGFTFKEQIKCMLK